MSAHNLPVELWLEVFAYLDYFCLKRCSRVNKAFQGIIEHPALQATLFSPLARNSFAEASHDHYQLSVHPLLAALAVTGPVSSLADLGIVDHYSQAPYRLLRIPQGPTLKDFATMPPIQAIELIVAHENREQALELASADPRYEQGMKRLAILVSEPKGITIRVVLEAVISCFLEGQPPRAQAYFRFFNKTSGNQHATIAYFA